jgi:hypothetical protein
LPAAPEHRYTLRTLNILPRNHPNTAFLLRLLAVGSIALVASCTSVTDLWENEVLSSDAADLPSLDIAMDAGPLDTGQDILLLPCDKEQAAACASQNKACEGGFCSDCLDGFDWDNNGLCVQEACPGLDCDGQHRECDETTNQCGDCSPGFAENQAGECSAGQCGPNTCVNQFCLDGFCLECLPGYYEDKDGVCREPNPCAPNPCTAPYKTSCSLSVEDENVAVCNCTDGASLNDAGDCLFDPCAGNPCEGQPKSSCTFDYSKEYECVCPEGTVDLGENCVDNPCEPNECSNFAQTDCLVLGEGAFDCQCDLGFSMNEGGQCIEVRVENLLVAPLVEEPITLDHGWNLFADDSLIAERPDFLRKIHPLDFGQATEWIVTPDLEPALIGQARAGGSLVQVPAAVRNKLPNGHPLKPYTWRLYYMGYRQLYAGDAQPAWLCVAAASSPNGPWLKPNLDLTSPQPNCPLRVDGLFQTEVTLRDGSWVLSATRLGMGEAQASPGIHVYTSEYGIFWTPQVEGAVIGMNVAPQTPAKYGRAGHLSRLVYDDRQNIFVGYLGLFSNAFGNARGVYFGTSAAHEGWDILPSPVQAPGILGPAEAELVNGIYYGDMVVWRQGPTYFGLVQKESAKCIPNEVLLVTSADQRHWVPVVDEVLNTIVPIVEPPLTNHFHTINSLTGGAPASTGGLWHFFIGGTQQLEDCSDQSPAGGIMKATSRAGGLVGLVADANQQATLVTRKFVLEGDLKAQGLRVNATVTDKMVITLERLSPIGTKLVAMQKVVSQGDHVDYAVLFGGSDSIEEATNGVFRLSFMFTGGGELFGFQLGDPVCSPNPCTDDPEKTTCTALNGEAVCLCDPPLHDDGEGHCTDDPCKPDPCVLPNQSACELVGGEPQCGCKEGWVPFSAVCLADPCQPSQDATGNPLPTPCLPLKCQAPNGVPECYCPEGSTQELTGCIETDMKAFVTSTTYSALELGGVEEAHSKCTAEAVNNGLTGSYAAWISTSEANAVDKFIQGGPWRTYDPELELWVKLVATSVVDLIDGTIQAPINYTAAGKPVAADCAVWTGTIPKGTVTPPIGNLGGTCGQWTSETPGAMAMAGLCSASDASWTAAGPRGCSEKLALYCFQVP